MKFLKEPLLHFLLIGAIFFGLYTWLNPDAMESDRHIVVDEGRINALAEAFERTWNRPPGNAELVSLVKDYALEEIYYRQALALGLDQNDAVIRRRLRQKVDFLSTSMATVAKPDESELQSFLDEHADIFLTSNRYSFEQIYVNPERSDAELEQRLSEIATALSKGETVDGDPTLMLRAFDGAPVQQVNNTFGSGFAGQLDDLPLNAWSRPLRSGLGFHFVRLSARETGVLPPLDDVREQVLRDWSYEKESEARRKVEADLLAGYQVDVEWPEEVGGR